MLSVSTDYTQSLGSPEPYLRRIADAGFSHVHWCHHWDSDFLYGRAEISQIDAWLREYGLALLDLHASQGVEKVWNSPREYERLAGVELVENRMEMTARLGSDVIVLHMGGLPPGEAAEDCYWSQTFKSFDALEPRAKELGVRIALENAPFDPLDKAMDYCAPEFAGICYDAGHGNLIPDGLDRIDALKDRLIAVHLHDNDGSDDQHMIPFTGTVDWDRMVRIMASSPYTKGISLEVTMRNAATRCEETFLAETFDAGTKLDGMLQAAGRS